MPKADFRFLTFSPSHLLTFFFYVSPATKNDQGPGTPWASTARARQK
ncbi:hypothetical protein D1AOALGA4SA_1554 [Olavius algarvensis Delta 1 endosymbiont]|nr:hypothetical protein D1AOALGA4SA_1554 [Olavius algarvensis Delta 1 endosymbiont]